jgi:hypothetical protein
VVHESLRQKIGRYTMPLTIISFIIFCLAVWRLSSLFANEDGPFNVFKKLRSIALFLQSNTKFFKAFKLHDGLECEWCNSLWFAFPLSFFIFERSFYNLFIVPLAVSTVVIFLKYILERIERQ